MAERVYANGDVDTDPIELTEPYQLRIDSGSAEQAGDIFDDGPSYGIEKTGAGTLSLTGDNTYDGPTLISAGRLVMDFSNGVDIASDVTIAAAGTLAFGAGLGTAFLGSIAGAGDIDLGAGVFLELDSISADLTFSGSIFDDVGGEGYFALCGCGGGSLTLTGASEIGGFLEVGNGGRLTIDGGSFTSGGTGLLLDGTLRIVNGGELHTTTINGTALVIDGAGSIATTSGDTFLLGTLTVSNGGRLFSASDATLVPVENDLATADVTGAGSRWEITGTLEMDVPILGGVVTVADGGVAKATVAMLVGTHSVIHIGTGGLAGTIDTPSIVNDGQILADFTNSSTLNADITGEGFLEKNGSGTLTLTGNSTYSGVTYLNGGRLNVNGAITSDLAVVAGTTLGGKGSVGVVIAYAGATVAPGTSVGALSTDDFTLLAGARLNIEIGGAAAGSGYDQVRVNGTVSIAGARLDLSILDGFEPRFGQGYTIIDNDGSDAVAGAFSGYAEGAVFLRDGRMMTITYAGGDGNDVVVSKTPPPTTIVGTAGADVIDATHTVAGQPLPTSDADHVQGLGGSDTIATLGGSDQVEAGNGKDSVQGGDGSDWISGGNGGDTLYGDAGSDTLKGGKGSDILRGGDGEDRLIGGAGKNKLSGGDGSDTFVFRNGSASDRITDFAAGDIIALARSAFSGIGPEGTLKAKYFHAGSAAETKAQHVLYDAKSGWLLYAKKGSNTAKPHELVKIGKHLDGFDHHDILVI